MKRTIYAIYFWQSNQSMLAQDIEEFPTLQAVKDALWRRDGDSYYPCNDETAEFLCSYTDPRHVDYNESDYIEMAFDFRVYFGPRMGLKYEAV